MPPLSRGVRSLVTRTLAVTRQGTKGRNSLHSGNLVISREVSEALKNGCPVVSLESTIITHGMPYPTNLEMAKEVGLEKLKQLSTKSN